MTMGNGEQPPACVVWQWVSDGLEAGLLVHPDCGQVPGRDPQNLILTQTCEKQSRVVPSFSL